MKSQAVPVSEIGVGLPFALLVIEIVAEVAPGAVLVAGAKTTLIEQVPAAAMVWPAQLSVSVKIGELEVTVPMINGALPVFVTVMTCGGALVVVSSWPPKATLDGDTEITAPLAVPVPDKATVRG